MIARVAVEGRTETNDGQSATGAVCAIYEPAHVCDQLNVDILMFTQDVRCRMGGAVKKNSPSSKMSSWASNIA
jgi:hypothetical protein